MRVRSVLAALGLCSLLIGEHVLGKLDIKEITNEFDTDTHVEDSFANDVFMYVDT